jgi:hypothetical protein
LHLRFGVRGLRQKLAVLILADLCAATALYFSNLIFVQTLLVVWNSSVMVGIVVWEKSSPSKDDALNLDVSADQRWGRMKMRIEWVDKRLAKANTESEKAALVKEKEWLVNELRRLEWSVKESELTSLSLASTGRLGILDSGQEDSGPLPLSFEEKNGVKALEKTVDNAVAVVLNEPEGSLTHSLRPLLNNLTAAYNALRRRDKHSPLLSDYWVVWAVLSARAKGQLVNSEISKYASKEVRPKILRLIEATQSRRGGSAERAVA